MVRHATSTDSSVQADSDRGDDTSGRELLREIHHQVKNNLQVVGSLLRIQSRALLDLDARAVFRRGEERIQCMVLVYDTLYRGASFSEVPLHQYLHEMVAQLVPDAAQGPNHPEIVCNFAPLFVTSRSATHLGLLINEILAHRLRQKTNSSERLAIVLRLLDRDGAIGFEIEDNGPSSEMSEGVSRVELQILDALVKQVQGEVSYAHGRRFLMTISIPKAVIQSPSNEPA